MKVAWVCNGDPERIPKVGDKIRIKDFLFFEVESYGDSRDVEIDVYDNGKTNKAYEIELFGHLVIPAGSPLEVLEELLGIDQI